jgi:hypothetical protein
MDVHLSSSGSIIDQELSNHGNTRAGLGISKMLEDQTTCTYGTQTLDGSSSSSMIAKVNSSSMLGTRKFLMLLVEEILKETMFRSGRRMDLRLSNSQSSMKTRKRRLKLLVKMKNSALKSTNHSI